MLQKTDVGFIVGVDGGYVYPRIPQNICRRWTRTSYECYKRNCTCLLPDDRCPMIPYCSQPHARFILKQVVIQLVKELGLEAIPDKWEDKELDGADNIIDSY